MSTAVIIPARWGSRRFEGKPCAMINGKPMILRVAERCAEAVGKENVHIATDDDRIINEVYREKFNCIHTGEAQFATGCDRVAYAASEIDADLIVNVQGDEVMVKPEDIKKAIEFKKIHHNHVINLFRHENDSEEKKSLNSIKVICGNGYATPLQYMSRMPIPTSGTLWKRQVCIYAFYRNQLLDNFGEGKQKLNLEASEDIEILRLIERHQPVMMVKTKNKYHSVDEPIDVKIVENMLNT